MKRLLLIALFFAASLNANSQDLNNEILFSVGEDKVTAEEYMAVYNKNRNLGEDIDPKTAREYLDLYLNFKLKVHEAKELEMDKENRFIQEFNSYRNQLAKPYLSDKDITQELLKEAYERMKLDVRASHIMLAASEDSDDMTKEKAFAKIKSLKARLDAGESFEKLAREYSADTYSAERGGDLGFFTVFGMVYPFESAAYNLEIGEISDPIQTRFGFHLVMKTDERPARGTIEASHILLISNEKSSQEEKDAAERKIKEIHSQILGGMSFEDAAMKYSEDRATSKRGGLLQPFAINKMYPEFEEAVFALKSEGDITEPVKTPVGWHIIKLMSKPGIDSFDKLKRELKIRVDKDSRSEQSRESIVKRLKLEYNFHEHLKVKKEAFAQIDESLLKMAYSSENAKGKDKVLFEFKDNSFTVGEFLLFVDNTQSKSRKSNNLRKEIRTAYNRFVDGKLINYEKTRLEDKYPEFRMLAREYYEGILLFDLTEKRVWKKSVIDTLGLENFYASHKNDFMWETRYDVQIIDAASKKLAKKAKKMLLNGDSIQMVLNSLNEDSELNIKIDEDVFEESENDLLTEYKPEAGVSKTIKKNSRYFIMIVKDKKAPTNKTLEEARGLVISAYQNKLEKDWIAELKGKYEVSINEEVLEKVIRILEEEK
tara:strand:+ start:124664 stop:126631 length:1968 start_codon:yes stop_codon:yes gene_type:complete